MRHGSLRSGPKYREIAQSDARSWHNVGAGVTTFHDIATCFEVTDDHVDAALRPATDLNDPGPRARVFALLDHMATIALPRQGASRILCVLARIATCDWLEGALEVRVFPDGDDSLIELVVDDGLSVSKLRDSLRLAVPYAELRKAIVQRPLLVSPLTPIEGPTDEGVILASELVDSSDAASLSAAEATLFASEIPPPSQRPPARSSPEVAAPLPPPARAPMPTLQGVAEPPPAVLARLTLTKRQVPAFARRNEDGSPPPRHRTTKSSQKRPPRPPRRPD